MEKIFGWGIRSRLHDNFLILDDIKDYLEGNDKGLIPTFLNGYEIILFKDKFRAKQYCHKIKSDVIGRKDIEVIKVTLVYFYEKENEYAEK